MKRTFKMPRSVCLSDLHANVFADLPPAFIIKKGEESDTHREKAIIWLLRKPISFGEKYRPASRHIRVRYDKATDPAYSAMGFTVSPFQEVLKMIYLLFARISQHNATHTNSHMAIIKAY